MDSHNQGPHLPHLPSLLCSPTSFELLKTRHRLCLRFSLSIQDKQSASSSGRTLGPLTKQSIILSAKPVWLHQGQGEQRSQCTIFPLCSFPLATNLFSLPPSPEQMDLTTLLKPLLATSEIKEKDCAPGCPSSCPGFAPPPPRPPQSYTHLRIPLDPYNPFDPHTTDTHPESKLNAGTARAPYKNILSEFCFKSYPLIYPDLQLNASTLFTTSTECINYNYKWSNESTIPPKNINKIHNK